MTLALTPVISVVPGLAVRRNVLISMKAAKTEALKSYTDPEIINVIEQGFDVGDRVVVSDHPIIDDEPGVVVGFQEDGWVVVEWEQFTYMEEFHWTELEKVTE